MSLASNFSASTYREIAATSTMHNIPRFGHTNEFAVVFSGDEDASADYFRGLLFAGIFIICIFFLWTVALIVLKCLGQKRVGFLSGAPFTKPPNSEHYHRPLYCRLTFMVAGFTLICFGVLLVTEGVTNLKTTINTVDESNSEIQRLVSEANGITDSLRNIGGPAMAIRDELVQNLGDFCPGEPDLATDAGIDFDEMAATAIVLLDQLGQFLDGDLAYVEDRLASAEKATQNVEDGVDNIHMNDWQALIILIPVIVIPSFLLVGVIMAWYEVSVPWYTCMLNWVFFPLFILVALAAYAGSGTVCILATVNADWCSGSDGGLGVSGVPTSPDNTVMRILDQNGVERTDLVFTAVQYYVQQCVGEDPFDFVRDYETELVSARDQVQELVAALTDDTIPQLEIACGREFRSLQTLLNVMAENLVVLVENARSVLRLLSCERLAPIYANTVYDGTCNYSIKGVTWTWSALLVIAFCAMIMLTLRSSWKETVWIKEWDDELEDVDVDAAVRVQAQEAYREEVHDDNGSLPTTVWASYSHSGDSRNSRTSDGLEL